jgi:hypothetical protein
MRALFFKLEMKNRDMKKYLFALLLVAAFACGPSRKDDPENSPESIDDGAKGQTPAQVLDSSQTVNDSTSTTKEQRANRKDSVKK